MQHLHTSFRIVEEGTVLQQRVTLWVIAERHTAMHMRELCAVVYAESSSPNPGKSRPERAIKSQPLSLFVTVLAIKCMVLQQHRPTMSRSDRSTHQNFTRLSLRNIIPTLYRHQKAATPEGPESIRQDREPYKWLYSCVGILIVVAPFTVANF